MPDRSLPRAVAHISAPMWIFCAAVALLGWAFAGLVIYAAVKGTP